MEFDVAIVGAGPAGCAAALELGKTPLRVVLIDRDTFPRDKVCGDAIPGPAVKALAEIDPRFADSLRPLTAAQRSRRTRLHLNGRRPVTLHWETRAYTCRRTDFDRHLLELVTTHTDTTILTGKGVAEVTGVPGNVTLTLSDGVRCTAAGVIGADGAHSVVARQLGGQRLDRAHHGGAVRQYYRGVTGLAPDRLEIHSLAAFMPGYFWIFPLSDGACNVGFGMHSTALGEHGLRLRHAIGAFVAASEELRERFADAAPEGAVRGFGLPFGSRRVRVQGDGFLLTGDAASLIDPLTGDGIGQAVGSGLLAARQAVRCWESGDWSARATAPYATALWNRYGGMLANRSRLLNAYRRLPFLVDWGARALAIGPVRRAVRPYL